MTDLSETSGAHSDTCVVIPMFNEATVIGDVVAHVRSQFDHVVCVDDGSSDDSALLAKQAGATVVRHLTNLGQGASLQTGLAFALRTTELRHFVTFDADGQHRVDDAVSMVERAREADLDVVLGSRFLAQKTQMSALRHVVLKAGVAFTRATTGLALTDTHNGLRVLNRRAAEAVRIRLHGMAHASEMLEQIARSGLTFEEFAVTVDYTDYSRAKGQPSINALNIAYDVLVQRMRTAR